MIVAIGSISGPGAAAQTANRTDPAGMNNTDHRPFIYPREDSQKDLPDYRRKHKTYKTAAWISLGVGVPLTMAGIVVSVASIENPRVNSSTGEWMAVAGAVSTIGSIPLFILSHKYKKKAARLSVLGKIEKIGSVYSYHQPAMAIQIEW